MKNYFVMGYQPEKNMIQNIVSVAYFVEDLAHCKNYEDYPFYRKSDLKSFKSLFMVTKDFKKYTFDILFDNPNRYVVSAKFLNILKSFHVNLVQIIPLILVKHRNHELRLENQYFYIEIETVSYKEVVDIEQSILAFEYDVYIEEITKLALKNTLETDFILIEELRTKIKTPICSEEFKVVCEKEKIRGVKFFEIEHTPWLKGRAMDNYFSKLRGGSTTETLETL